MSVIQTAHEHEATEGPYEEGYVKCACGAWTWVSDSGPDWHEPEEEHEHEFMSSCCDAPKDETFGTCSRCHDHTGFVCSCGAPEPEAAVQGTLLPKESRFFPPSLGPRQNTVTLPESALAAIKRHLADIQYLRTNPDDILWITDKVLTAIERRDWEAL